MLSDWTRMFGGPSLGCQSALRCFARYPPGPRDQDVGQASGQCAHGLLSPFSFGTFSIAVAPGDQFPAVALAMTLAMRGASGAAGWLRRNPGLASGPRPGQCRAGGRFRSRVRPWIALTGCTRLPGPSVSKSMIQAGVGRPESGLRPAVLA